MICRAVASLLIASSLSAQTIELCKATSERLCKLTPPPTFQMKKAQPPFNAPVMSGGPATVSGAPYWLWLKAGEPPTPCTAKTHAGSPGGNEPRCSAKIGDALYITQQFTVKSARTSALASTATVQLSLAPECSSKDERFRVPRYACLRVPAELLTGVRAIEVVNRMANRSTGVWPVMFTPASDGSITIPFRVDDGPLGTRRVELYGISADWTYALMLPETRLLDLPIYTGAQ